METTQTATDTTSPIYPQDAEPWYVQQKLMRDDWRTVGIVPRANHTRSEAISRYSHLEGFGKLRAVSKSQAQNDYEAGRAHRPDAI